VFLSELKEGLQDESESQHSSTTDLTLKITVIMRRILPGLRLYSSWFTKNWATLAADLNDVHVREQLQNLWRCYAEVLTTLVETFPADRLPSVEYMLEEDAETISFEPLISPLTNWIWFSEGSPRAKFSEVDRSHPNDEMLIRIRGLLVNGLELAHRVDEVNLLKNTYRAVADHKRRPYRS
jgi:hypothetical protein